ncbi:hypothetical protein AK812_SmicGene45172 [Symbiodinium microadriaticum]|uniref:C3H1-type domain-containing protein n=1 Tax=Symbiodinium microadriaticum TaxID=2951 RepID=A0A1Q9BWL1_SYMMI|nr:hypothetical protein AK812_SmicGene45172 [Symbiodinium microadriaticum]
MWSNQRTKRYRIRAREWVRSSTPGIGASYAGIVDDDEGISSFVHRGTAGSHANLAEVASRGTTTDGRVYATVMLKQMTAAEKERDGDQSPETVKPGTTTLPPLPAVRVETASVDIMDWLEMLTSPMSDLSDGSGLWWERVKSTATHSYVQWAQASPMERLKISPPRDEALESGKWSRVNSRASSMLMLALAEGVRSEMVARRLTGSATSILYRLMTLYQPAGEEEKMRILRNLQEPPQEGDPQRALEALRSWERWLRRCRELGVTAPDPALLARGLTAMVRKLMDQYPEASFRTSLVKSTLMVDTRPTMESVDGYYRHLLAECETLAVGLTSSTTSMQNTSTKPEPKMKPMKPEAATPIPPPPPLPTNRSSSQNTSGGEEGDKEKRATTPCRYFGKTFKGCARGSKCPFQHTWEGNEKEKAQRCWVCGGKHLTKQCPNQKPNPSTSSTTTPNAKATPQTPRTPPSSGTQTTTTKSVRIDDKPQVEQVPARTSSSSAAPEGSTPDIKEMLSDVGKMLKQMTAANAKKIAVVEQGFEQKLEEIEAAMKLSMVEAEDDAMDGLLDSGATHAMRVAEGNEYETGSSVKVTLAGEDVREMRQNLQGTVLIENDGRQAVQPIVALGAVIEDLDCSLSWRRGSFQLRHPEKGVLKVKLVNNCPEIKAKDALALIKELENKHMVKLTHQVEDLKARLEVLRKEETRSRDNILKEYVKNGSQALLLRAILVCPFTKDLPEDVQAMIAEGFEEHHGLNYLKQLPLTRRKRKLLLASNQWVVVFNQGATENAEEPINAMAKQGKVVLYVDPSSSRLWDVHRKSGVYQMLLWAASQGKIADVLASPPSATWTTAMSEQMGQDVASMRTKAHPYGHDGLPPLKQQLLNNETAAVAKCMMLWLVATMSGKGNVGFLLEQYSPGDELRSDDSGSISLWSTQLWKSFKALTGMSQVSFYMGAIGHRGKRPTGMATNYPRLCQIEGMCDFVDGALPTTLMDVKEMKTWSVKFQEIVAQAACESLNGVFADEEELTQLDVKLSKLTKEQKESWRKHLLNDHQPYRSDCSVCINAQATGYQHRRRAHPNMFTVAIDLAGPFKQKGRDMDHDDYKYLMVAAYRCPREYMSSKAISDYNAELYVPDEPDDPPDDPLALQEEELSEVEEGDKESGGDDAEETPQGRDEIEEEAEKLSKPQQAATIYLCRPLRRRTTAHVLQATKEIVVQLKQTGLHIAGLHSDRAREFKAKAFKDWVTDAGLKQTKTAGGDPSGNSTAELGIKWIKSRMRSLLRASDSPPRDWPMAASHATASLWGKAFPDSPSFHPPVTTFGNAVWFRAKSYKGTKEKKHEAAGTRWKKGWYKGPSMDVHRGHLIAREDGGLAIAKGVKFNVFDVKENPELRDLLPPAVAEGVPSEDKEDEFPPSKDELMEEIEFRARTMLDQSTVTINDILEIYYKLEGLGDTDRRIKNKAEVKSWFTGAFVHGGKAGPRINVEKFPYASKLLVEFGKQFAEGKSFSAVGIARNSQLGLHRDSHNDPTSSNIIVPLTSFEYGDLWIQDDGVQEEERVTKKLPNGKELKGRILPLEKGKATFFHPRVWHEVQPWKGDRVVLLMFTPRSSKLSQEDIAKLQEIGLEFPQLPEADEHDGQYSEDEESPIPVRVKMMSVQEEQMPYVFEEITDEDLLPGGGEHPLLPEEEGDEPADVRTMVGARLKKIIKKAEVQYTPDIEQVLHDLEAQGQQLQVTHTVNPQEVRKNLDLWKPSAVKEFRNLTEVKNALKVVKRNLLPPDCRIVPCKGVYTIKPDKGTPGYRRKTRLVACGNHVPEGETTFDLYAAGLDAASLRSVLAFSSSRDSWRFGVTDIRQAFVLARWLGGPVALQPPSVAFEWGLAQPGDMWLVQQAIYGLRESPAMWSQFRDEQLALARWNSVVDGKVVAMKLEQMVTDNQIWRIVREDGQGGTQGYLMVYIDDLLINAPDAVMWTFFEWLSAKWEVDELDVLDEGHPIKFLGTELHKVNGGVEMAQEGFVRELLRTYGHKGLRSKLQGPRETMILSDEEERALIEAEPVDTTGKEVIIKEAQRRVGELLWLMGRQQLVTLSTAESELLEAVEGMVLGRAMKGLLDELSERGEAKTAGGDVGDQRQKKLYVYGEYKGGESSFLLVVYIGDDVSGTAETAHHRALRDD